MPHSLPLLESNSSFDRAPHPQCGLDKDESAAHKEESPLVIRRNMSISELSRLAFPANTQTPPPASRPLHTHPRPHASEEPAGLFLPGADPARASHQHESHPDALYAATDSFDKGLRHAHTHNSDVLDTSVGIKEAKHQRGGPSVRVSSKRRKIAGIAPVFPHTGKTKPFEDAFAYQSTHSETAQNLGAQSVSSFLIPSLASKTLNRWAHALAHAWIIKEFAFVMNKLSLVGLVTGLMMLGALFFGAGFLTAYKTSSQPPTDSQPVAYGHRAPPPAHNSTPSPRPTSGNLASGGLASTVSGAFKGSVANSLTSGVFTSPRGLVNNLQSSLEQPGRILKSQAMTSKNRVASFAKPHNLAANAHQVYHAPPSFQSRAPQPSYQPAPPHTHPYAVDQSNPNMGNAAPASAYSAPPLRDAHPENFQNYAPPQGYYAVSEHAYSAGEPYSQNIDLPLRGAPSFAQPPYGPQGVPDHSAPGSSGRIEYAPQHDTHNASYPRSYTGA